MPRYLDTSLLVAVLVREPGTEAAKTYLAAAGSDILLISPWVTTEFSSALALKVRTGAITEAEQTAALTMFRRLAKTRLRRLDFAAGDFDTAAWLCDQVAAPLRAGHALHLAICRRNGARLATFDRGLAHAARWHGLPCDLLAA